MFVFTLPLLSLLLKEITCTDVVSSEKGDVQDERVDKHTSNADINSRRFNEDLDDNEWHIAHLKDTEFSRRSECAEDTLQDKVDRYRKALKNDGSLVQFVSSDAIPFDKTEFDNRSRTCHSPSNYAIFLKNIKRKMNDRNSTSTTLEEKNMKEKEKILDTATTAQPILEHDKVDNKTASRRASEYQFSSDEYYDEVTDFDENVCPDDVEVITLEEDQLRNYDVECELTIEWHSLE